MLPSASPTPAAVTPAKSQPKTKLIQAIAVPTRIATRPPGTPPGKRTPANQAPKMIATETRPMTGASMISNAGRIEMKVIEMPAKVPSSAALGVNRRTCGAMKAPAKSTRPSINTHASPAW